MADAGLNAERFAKGLLERTPACQWLINRAHRFHFVTGDSGAIFYRSASEMHGQHVSMIDDQRGVWEARLGQVFSGAFHLERPSQYAPGYSFIHIPLRAEDKSVLYAAGFAYALGQQIPAESELELASLLLLLAVEAERTRTSRFLHDVVAQSLSGAGLQIELLRLDVEGHGFNLTDRASEIQRLLEDALQRVRQFRSEKNGASE